MSRIKVIRYDTHFQYEQGDKIVLFGDHATKPMQVEYTHCCGTHEQHQGSPNTLLHRERRRGRGLTRGKETRWTVFTEKQKVEYNWEKRACT